MHISIPTTVFNFNHKGEFYFVSAKFERSELTRQLIHLRPNIIFNMMRKNATTFLLIGLKNLSTYIHTLDIL